MSGKSVAAVGRRVPAARPRVSGRPAAGTQTGMEFLLWILAVILVVAGIVSLFRARILWGIVLIIIGLLVGPGGVSVFT